MNRRPIINLNLHTLPSCGKCGGRKTVIRLAGRTTVLCSKCDK